VERFDLAIREHGETLSRGLSHQAQVTPTGWNAGSHEAPEIFEIIGPRDDQVGSTFHDIAGEVAAMALGTHCRGDMPAFCKFRTEVGPIAFPLAGIASAICAPGISKPDS
jgi:hypothetical protein